MHLVKVASKLAGIFVLVGVLRQGSGQGRCRVQPRPVIKRLSTALQPDSDAASSTDPNPPNLSQHALAAASGLPGPGSRRAWQGPSTGWGTASGGQPRHTQIGVLQSLCAGRTFIIAPAPSWSRGWGREQGPTASPPGPGSRRVWRDRCNHWDTEMMRTVSEEERTLPCYFHGRKAWARAASGRAQPGQGSRQAWRGPRICGGETRGWDLSELQCEGRAGPSPCQPSELL